MLEKKNNIIISSVAALSQQQQQKGGKKGFCSLFSEECLTLTYNVVDDSLPRLLIKRVLRVARGGAQNFSLWIPRFDWWKVFWCATTFYRLAWRWERRKLEKIAAAKTHTFESLWSLCNLFDFVFASFLREFSRLIKSKASWKKNYSSKCEVNANEEWTEEQKRVEESSSERGRRKVKVGKNFLRFC